MYRFGHKVNVWVNKIRFHTQINRFDGFQVREPSQQNTGTNQRGDNEKRFINFKFINKTQVVIVWCMCQLGHSANKADYWQQSPERQFINNHQIIKSE